MKAATNLFAALCRSEGLPTPTPEHRFRTDKRSRFDFAWPEHFVALEVEGGIWMKGGGRHNRGSGMLRDMEKYNKAATLGWLLIRVTPQQLCTLATIQAVRDAILIQSERWMFDGATTNNEGAK